MGRKRFEARNCAKQWRERSLKKQERLSKAKKAN